MLVPAIDQSVLDFSYWLNGFLDIEKPESLNKAQIEAIKQKLDETLDKQAQYEKDFNTPISVSIPLSGYTSNIRPVMFDSPITITADYIPMGT